MINEDEKFYWFWMANIPGLGNLKMEKLLSVFDSPKELYRAQEKALRASNILKEKDIECISEMKKNSIIYKEYLELKKKKIRLITLADEEYPYRLKQIYDRPVCLYLKGKLPDEKKHQVAIVGARACSEYGKQTTYQIAKGLAMAGINVISGMARGIDSAGHKGALAAEGFTLGVLAGGVDVCYPRENIEIYSQMCEHGGILSEYPPGMQPLSCHFPLRNRIISGLSDVVVVVEAREKSGSLITADMALEQNRTVMAVPGRICDALSSGCNNLIKMGAGVVCDVEDILEILNCEIFLNKPEPKEKNKKIMNLLAREEKMLYSCLDLTPKNLNIILEETGLEMSVVMENLVSLELKGAIKEVSRGYYVRTRISSEGK